MTRKEMEQQALEAATNFGLTYGADAKRRGVAMLVAGRDSISARDGYRAGFRAAAEPRERELERLRAKLAEAKAAIRWMHGYDEPGTEDFPICPEGKRFAWRIVARQQFAIVREACSEVMGRLTHHNKESND